MKFKKVGFILVIIVPILISFGFPAFTVAQSYDEIVMVDPDDYRAYETSFNPREFGWAWKNYLVLTLICNDTEWIFYVVNTDGYYQFLLRKRFGDISSNNYKIHRDGSYSINNWDYTVNEEIEDGFNPIYVIIYNDDEEVAIWEIRISTSSEYIWWVTWWFLTSIFVVLGIIIAIPLIKYLRKKY